MEFKSAIEEGMIDGYHYDSMQNELINIIKKGGLTPSNDSYSQVSDVLFTYIDKKFKEIESKIDKVKIKVKTTPFKANLKYIYYQDSRDDSSGGGGHLKEEGDKIKDTLSPFDRGGLGTGYQNPPEVEFICKYYYLDRPLYADIMIDLTKPLRNDGRGYKTHHLFGFTCEQTFTLEEMGLPSVWPSEKYNVNGSWLKVEEGGRLKFQFPKYSASNIGGLYSLRLYYE